MSGCDHACAGCGEVRPLVLGVVCGECWFALRVVARRGDGVAGGLVAAVRRLGPAALAQPRLMRGLGRINHHTPEGFRRGSRAGARLRGSPDL